MTANFISKHPRFTYLLSGFFMGLIVAGSLWYGNRGAADLLKSEITKLEARLAQEEYAHNQLKTTHKELKTSFNESFEEIIKPDGTKIVRKITKNDTDSVSSSTDSSSETSSKTNKTTIAETSKIETETKDLDIRLDYSTRLELGLHGYYRILPPFNMGVSVKFDPKNPNVINELAVGIGIRL